MTATPRDWDARTYDAVADPQARWGIAVVERLVARWKATNGSSMRAAAAAA